MEQNPYAPPSAEVDDTPRHPAAAPAPAMWNPNAAALWSLVLTPAFGAFLQMKNWQALGEPARAETSRKWFVGVIAAMLGAALLAALLPETKAIDAVSRVFGVALLVTWYLQNGREQVQFVLGRHGKAYPRRSWALALLGGVLGLAAYVGALFVVGFLAGLVLGLE